MINHMKTAVLSAALAFAGMISAAQAADLIMVEEPGCVWCAQWERDLGAIYPKTPEGKFAPLQHVQIRDTRKDTLGFTLTRPVSFTPTFVLIEDGAEIGRIEGYPGEDFFWGLLDQMLTNSTDYIKPTS